MDEIISGPDARLFIKKNENEPLNEEEENIVNKLYHHINDLYIRIPDDLRDRPKFQELCLGLLLEAEDNLMPPYSRTGIIRCRLALTRIELALGRARNVGKSTNVVAFIIYVFAAALIAGYHLFPELVRATPEQLMQVLVVGIPLPIIFWAGVGSSAAMLLRAGKMPFTNTAEAIRWLMFRPVVGMIMGVMTYLMITAGLLVFTGNSPIESPSLLWIIAFLGSFSDTLSVDLMHKLSERLGGNNRRAENDNETMAILGLKSSD